MACSSGDEWVRSVLSSCVIASERRAIVTSLSWTRSGLIGQRENAPAGGRGWRGPLDEKLFRYARYNAELTPEGLKTLGCDDVDPASVQKLDSIDALESLQRVGEAVARQKVDAGHFNLDVSSPEGCTGPSIATAIAAALDQGSI